MKTVVLVMVPLRLPHLVALHLIPMILDLGIPMTLSQENLAAGSYQVTLSDDNFCEQYANINIGNNPAPTSDPGNSGTLTCTDNYLILDGTDLQAQVNLNTNGTLLTDLLPMEPIRPIQELNKQAPTFLQLQHQVQPAQMKRR
ncbi:MAG: hypothetical protein R2784_03960 [Saprospiraceae bacterium]